MTGYEVATAFILFVAGVWLIVIIWSHLSGRPVNRPAHEERSNMPILVCLCGNPAHSTIAAMESCYWLRENTIAYPQVGPVDFGRN